tara:strand:- start:1635 stop:2630 length:996 start_codon:yes stop_codon:yes gene_type:complete
MSYGRVKTPRIYVDWVNWLLLNGKITTSDITSTGGSFASGSNVHELFDLDPSNIQTISVNGTSTDTTIIINTNITDDSRQGSNYIAILGHNLKEADANIVITTDDTDGSFQNPATLTEVCNATVSNSNTITPALNGWSLVEFTTTSQNQKIKLSITDVGGNNFNSDVKIGSIMVGKYYDFPFNPDLKFNRQDVFNNVISTSQGGRRYSNFLNAPRKSWVLDQWQLATATSPSNIYDAGKKVLTFNFSFMSDDVVYPENDGGSALSNSTDFYSAVLNKSYGSHLPVIVHLDNTQTFTTAQTPNNIMLARIFNTKINQTAVNHYSVSLTLEEI